MFTAVTSSGQLVIAEVASLLGGEFFCPKCGAPVLIRKGIVKVEHFAHLSRTSCEYAGESSLHLQMKHQIFKYLESTIAAKVKSITIEKLLGTVRPDIYIEGKKNNIAIEVQASALTPEEILLRTTSYYEKGVYVIWVIPFDENRFMKEIRRLDELIGHFA